MITKQYNHFQKTIKKHVAPLKKKKKISESEFEGFIKKILSDKSLEIDGKIYARTGFSYIHKISKHTFQILTFQVNSFGAGIFDKKIKKLCTPVMITITAHGTHPHLQHNLRDTSISIDEFYLGKQYTGSKGPLCKRDEFNDHAKKLFISDTHAYSFNHNITYHLMNANYLCHHIAEVMGYAFGALDVFWKHGKKSEFFMSSASWFSNNQDKLYINIIDDFAGEKMSGHFQIPHYAKLTEDLGKFKEEFDNLLCTIDYKKDMETYYLPIGYQVVHGKRFKKNINVITSQHILDHLLQEYYKRKNTFVVTSTFQTLEYLSRAFIAKMEGKDKVFGDFMRSVTSCLGYYPERDFKKLYKDVESKYGTFASEYAHTLFFRAPVLK